MVLYHAFEIHPRIRIFIDNILLYGYITICLSILLLMDIWAISNLGLFIYKAAINIF